MSVEMASDPGVFALVGSSMRLDVAPEILQHLPVAVYACDAQGRILWFNARAADIWGRSPRIADEAEKYCGSYLCQLNGRPIAHDETPMAAVLRSGQALRGVECQFERPDGSRVWAVLHIEPVKDESGHLIGAISCFHETTATHVIVDTTAEQAAADEVRHRLATIVETSDDAIISKNLDGIIMTWNRGAERIFGYTAEEVVGKPVTVLMPPERYDEEPGILARLRRGERIDHYETVRRRKDGTLIDISLTVSPVRDNAGHIVGAAKIARDITGQKRAEKALRDSERRAQDLLSAIPAAIYTTDAAGKITYYNEAAVEFAGRRPIIGTDKWCITWKMYWPDGTLLAPDECPMAVALKEGRPVRGKEAVAERPDGTRIPFLPFPTPIRDAGGKVIGAINLLVDISERKQAETQQRLLLRELNHRVKNNMQMLQSLLYAAKRQTRNQEAAKVLEDAAGRITAMAAAQRVLYSTNDATRFKVSEFLDAVCSTAQQTFPPDVRIVYEGSDGELDNDVAMPLALILNELLTNAVKYGRSRDGENLVRVALRRDNGGFVLSVEDGGPGFDLEAVKERASGLKLVQLLARQLRGHFEVANSRCSLRFG
jgi:PAS domain S-box-containing protein